MARARMYCDCNDYIKSTPCTDGNKTLWIKHSRLTGDGGVIQFQNKCYYFDINDTQQCPSGGVIIYGGVSSAASCEDCVGRPGVCCRSDLFGVCEDNVYREDCVGEGQTFNDHYGATCATTRCTCFVDPSTLPPSVLWPPPEGHPVPSGMCQATWSDWGACCFGSGWPCADYVPESYCDIAVADAIAEYYEYDPFNPLEPRSYPNPSFRRFQTCYYNRYHSCGPVGSGGTCTDETCTRLVPAIICSYQETPPYNPDAKPVVVKFDDLSGTDPYVFKHDQICYMVNPVQSGFLEVNGNLVNYDIVDAYRDYDTCLDCVSGFNLGGGPNPEDNGLCPGQDHPELAPTLFIPTSCLPPRSGVIRHKGYCYYIDIERPPQPSLEEAEPICICDIEYDTCDECRCGERITRPLGIKAYPCAATLFPEDIWIPFCAEWSIPGSGHVVFRHNNQCYHFNTNGVVQPVSNGAVLVRPYNAYTSCIRCYGNTYFPPGGGGGNPDPDPPVYPPPPGGDPDAEYGTCCITTEDGETCILTTQTGCQVNNGTFHAGIMQCDVCGTDPEDPPVDPPVEPPPPVPEGEGVCCFADGSCAGGVTGSDCSNMGGSFHGGAANCSVCPYPDDDEDGDPDPPPWPPQEDPDEEPDPDDPEYDSLELRNCLTNEVVGAVLKSSGVAGKIIFVGSSCVRVTQVQTNGGMSYLGPMFLNCATCEAAQEYYHLDPCDEGEENLWINVVEWLMCAGSQLTNNVLKYGDNCYTRNFASRQRLPLPSGAIIIDPPCSDYRTDCEHLDCIPPEPVDCYPCSDVGTGGNCCFGTNSTINWTFTVPEDADWFLDFDLTVPNDGFFEEPAPGTRNYELEYFVNTTGSSSMPMIGCRYCAEYRSPCPGPMGDPIVEDTDPELGPYRLYEISDGAIAQWCGAHFYLMETTRYYIEYLENPEYSTCSENAILMNDNLISECCDTAEADGSSPHAYGPGNMYSPDVTSHITFVNTGCCKNEFLGCTEAAPDGCEGDCNPLP